MRGLAKDWRGWNPVERLAALAILAVALLGPPALLAMNLH
jgi:hypothetical protein